MPPLSVYACCRFSNTYRGVRCTGGGGLGAGRLDVSPGAVHVLGVVTVLGEGVPLESAATGLHDVVAVVAHEELLAVDVRPVLVLP